MQVLAKLLLDDLGLPADTRIELITHRNRRLTAARPHKPTVPTLLATC
ncbi:hypothetical protein GCM10010452_20740 [Crossiella cryophila]